MTGDDTAPPSAERLMTGGAVAPYEPSRNAALNAFQTNALLGGAFQPAPVPARAPLRLGLCPPDHMTLQEVHDRAGRGLHELFPDSEADLIRQFVALRLSAALARGDLEALVVFDTAAKPFRVPYTCWVPTKNALHAATRDEWIRTTFSNMLLTNCLVGPRFGQYETQTPFFCDAAARDFINQLVVRDDASTEPAEAEVTEAPPEPGGVSAPPITSSVDAWVKLPAVEQAARTNIVMAGDDPDDERTMRAELLRLGQEHRKGLSAVSIKNSRNRAGKKIRYID